MVEDTKSVESASDRRSAVKRLVSVFDEPDCLACDPFEGDFGEPGDRTLKDKIGRARKPGPCHLCNQEITPGETIRMRTDIFEGELMSFRWCSACCAAMAKSWTDNGDAYEKRAALRQGGGNEQGVGGAC